MSEDFFKTMGDVLRPFNGFHKAQKEYDNATPDEDFEPEKHEWELEEEKKANQLYIIALELAMTSINNNIQYLQKNDQKSVGWLLDSLAEDLQDLKNEAKKHAH